MRDSEVMKMMAILQAAYWRRPLEEPTITLYREMLADLPAAQALTALRDIIRESKWAPTVAEIRERTLEQMPRLPAPSHVPQLSPEQRIGVTEVREAVARMMARWNGRS